MALLICADPFLSSFVPRHWWPEAAQMLPYKLTALAALVALAGHVVARLTPRLHPEEVLIVAIAACAQLGGLKVGIIERKKAGCDSPRLSQRNERTSYQFVRRLPGESNDRPSTAESDVTFILIAPTGPSCANSIDPLPTVMATPKLEATLRATLPLPARV